MYSTDIDRITKWSWYKFIICFDFIICNERFFKVRLFVVFRKLKKENTFISDDIFLKAGVQAFQLSRVKMRPWSTK